MNVDKSSDPQLLPLRQSKTRVGRFASHWRREAGIMKEYSGTDPSIFIYVNCFSTTLTNVVIYSFGSFSLKTKSNIFGIIIGQVGIF
jgi:hypothetical protein